LTRLVRTELHSNTIFLPTHLRSKLTAASILIAS
jgi:hypothetical protein